MESTKLNYQLKGEDVYILPKDGKFTETFIFLHGLGDTATGPWLNLLFGKDVTPCLPTTKVILLQAPTSYVTIKGMRVPSWYDIKGFQRMAFNFEEAVGADEVRKNTEKIQKLLREETKALGGDSKKIILAGFSQGCAMAIHAGLQFDKSLGGIIGWSGYMFPVTKTHEANANTPMYIVNGTDDGTVPCMLADLSYMNLSSHKNLTRIREKGMGHIINEKIVKGTADFIKKILGRM